MRSGGGVLGQGVLVLVAVVFMMVTADVSAAQGVRLYGKVLDSRTHEPISKALGSIRERKIETTTNPTGAVVMGRHAYDLADGDFTGYEYQVPIFVLTHHPPQAVTKGQNDKLKVSFVTDGIENAIERAKAAAGEKDVTIVGGASTAQQVINARLFDQIEIGIVPVLLGGGLRFFDNASIESIELEPLSILESPSRIDLRFRVVR